MSLRDLNWHKGFFRLWVLASSIWIIVLGTVGIYPSATRYFESLKAVREIQHSKDKPVVPSQEDKIDAFLDSPIDAKIDAFLDSPLENRNQAESDYEYVGPLEQTTAEEFPKKYELNKTASSKKSRKHDLLFYSGMTFLPPALVLLLGMGFMWAFSGFTPNKTSRTG